MPAHQPGPDPGRQPGLRPGDAVRVEMTKWGDLPHWQMPATYLGSDEHGDWIGFPVGTHMARPGAEFTTTNEQVGLVPRDGAFVATFHGPGFSVWTYVDMTTPPVWDGTVVRAVDLDLDVVERLDHTVYVDDEDEFAEHQVSLGYPAEVVALAEATAAEVLAAVRERTTPFDGAATPWFDVLRAVSR